MKKKALNITGLLFKEIPWKREKEKKRESIDHLKRPKSKRQKREAEPICDCKVQTQQKHPI